MPEPLQFEHFEVLRSEEGRPMILGQGGMGITYKAFDTRLGKTVALKMIRSDIGDPELAKARFSREARLAAQLHHPNVVPIHHFGDSGGQLFYAMEFCDGPTIEQLVAQRVQAGAGPLPPDLALSLCAQIASALAEAERLRLTHRDIKPSNVIVLSQADGEQTAKLIDFGLAKAVLASNTGTAQVAVTETRGFTGSYRYASPEQLREQEMDMRSDIYSLGATLWFMLFAEPPFEGNSVAMVITRVLRDPLPADHLVRLPKPLADLLERMLAKEPEQRPQTALELKSAIRECIRKTRKQDTALVPVAMSEGVKVMVKPGLLTVGTTTHSSTTVAPPPLPRTEVIRGKTQAVFEWIKARPILAGGAGLALFICGAALLFHLIVRRPDAGQAPSRRHDSEVSLAEQAADLRKQAEDLRASNPAKGVELLRKAIGFGDARAERDLAYWYRDGTGVEQSNESALLWMTKAADHGLPEAQYDLGDWYADPNGRITHQNWEMAFSLYGKAAKQGLAAAQKAFGKCYLNGNGVAIDKKTAFEWFMKAAEQDYPDAENNVGASYENGWGVEKNPQEAFRWYMKAAPHGNPITANNIARCYALGIGVQRDSAKAVEWYRKAAEKNFPESQYWLGYAYESGTGVPKDLKVGLEWYTKAANQAYSSAECAVGRCYQYGLGTPIDLNQAYYWLKRSADQGLPYGQSSLGVLYYDGLGVKRDRAAAAQLWQKSVSKGDSMGAYGLGLCYYNGEGVPVSFPRALQLFEQADRGNFPAAGFGLGVYYAEGKAVPKNIPLAVSYFQKAARLGINDAQNWLKKNGYNW